MNVIEIAIGHKTYKISCNPGEEEHVKKLAGRLNERFNKLEASLGDKASDNMILVIIGLMLEDETLNNNATSVNSDSNSNKEKVAKLSTKIDDIVSRLEAIQ